MTLQGPYQFSEKKGYLVIRGTGDSAPVYRLTADQAYDVATKRTDNLWLSTDIRVGVEAGKLLSRCYDEQQLWRFKYGVLLADGTNRLIRKYAGYDAAVVDAMAGGEVHLGPDVPERNTHPVAAAARFLVANGCDQDNVLQYIKWLGHVPVAFAKAAHAGRTSKDVTDNVICDTVANHPGFGEGFCQYIEHDLLRNVIRWFSGEQVEDARVNLLASRAWLRSQKPEGVGADFLYNVVRMYKVPAHGVCLAIVLATRLLFAGWLSKQYHPDMFDDMIFSHVTTRETYSQAFKKV
jgi:hypothetical protein